MVYWDLISAKGVFWAAAISWVSLRPEIILNMWVFFTSTRFSAVSVFAVEDQVS